MKRHCLVLTIGADKELYSLETEADSLFAAAHQALREWNKLWWFSPDCLLEVRAGERRWSVSARRVSTWHREQFQQKQV